MNSKTKRNLKAVSLVVACLVGIQAAKACYIDDGFSDAPCGGLSASGVYNGTGGGTTSATYSDSTPRTIYWSHLRSRCSDGANISEGSGWETSTTYLNKSKAWDGATARRGVTAMSGSGTCGSIAGTVKDSTY